MNNKIDQILSELYESDPSLRQHDAVLRKVVSELMTLKPNTQLDENFRVELRRRLMQIAETQPQKLSLINFMKKFQLIGASVALVALVAVSTWYLNGLNSPTNSLTSMLSGGPKITQAGQNAFGTLANLTQGGRGQGGGGNGNESLTMAQNPVSADSTTPSDVGMADDAKLIAPASNLRYVYKGEELSLVMEQVDVLKRIKNEGSSNLSDFINRISFGLINLNSFDNAKLQNFTFAEDKEFGYMVNVMLNEGTINIYENWEKWQALYTPCGGAETMSTRDSSEMCVPQKRIDISEVPADDVVINAANSFLDKYGIARSNYGSPIINKDWFRAYESSPDKANYWIPETLNVIYPLQLNGQSVYDESGNPNGLNVSVRYSPQLRVSNVYELTTQNYQSSSYQAETDVNRIMALVEKGGFRNYYYMDANAKTVDVELGTPEVSYVKLWNYSNNVSEELLVPALIFPVTKHPEITEPYYWPRNNVVIPLVKEILDNENNGGGIMPLADTVRAE